MFNLTNVFVCCVSEIYFSPSFFNWERVSWTEPWKKPAFCSLGPATIYKCPMMILVYGRKWRNRAVLIGMKPQNQKLNCVITGIAQQRPFLLEGHRRHLCMNEIPDSWADVTQNYILLLHNCTIPWRYILT